MKTFLLFLFPALQVSLSLRKASEYGRNFIAQQPRNNQTIEQEPGNFPLEQSVPWEFESFGASVERNLPGSSTVSKQKHHEKGAVYSDDDKDMRVKTSEPLSVMKWGTFVVMMVLGCVAEIMFLKTWNKDVDVKTALAALVWWIIVAAFFCGYLASQQSHPYSWIDGYILELMLSFDNLFVFVLIMDAFRIPSLSRNRILLLSVIFSFACRLVMFEVIAAMEAIGNIITQILGVFIAYCAYKVLMLDDDEDIDFANSPAILFLSKFLPVTTEVDAQGSFFIGNKATASFLALFSLIIFDMIFAVDSVTAKSAFIESTFINFTSSAFAMVMIRAAYFLLDNAIDMFKYLKYGIGIILFVIAFMAVFPGLVPLSNFQYCGILLAILTISVVASMLVPHQEESNPQEDAKDGSQDRRSSKSVVSRLRLADDTSSTSSTRSMPGRS